MNKNCRALLMDGVNNMIIRRCAATYNNKTKVDTLIDYTSKYIADEIQQLSYNLDLLVLVFAKKNTAPPGQLIALQTFLQLQRAITDDLITYELDNNVEMVFPRQYTRLIEARGNFTLKQIWQ